VTPSGMSTIAVYADSDTNFGSGEDEASLLLGEQANSYLVQFDASGKVLFRETASSINPSVNSIYDLAAGPNGAVGFGTSAGTHALETLQAFARPAI
jgi:hypothetical protein